MKAVLVFFSLLFVAPSFAEPVIWLQKKDSAELPGCGGSIRTRMKGKNLLLIFKGARNCANYDLMRPEAGPFGGGPTPIAPVRGISLDSEGNATVVVTPSEIRAGMNTKSGYSSILVHLSNIDGSQVETLLLYRL